MNWDTIEGNWKQFKGNALQQWGKLTGDQLAEWEKRMQALGASNDITVKPAPLA